MIVGETWADGSVRLPDAIESWLDGHFDGEKGDDAVELEAGRNATAVALWSLIYRQGDPETDQAALDALVEAATASPNFAGENIPADSPDQQTQNGRPT